MIYYNTDHTLRKPNGELIATFDRKNVFSDEAEKIAAQLGEGSTVEGLEDQIDELEEEQERLHDQIDELEEEQERLHDQIAELEAKIATLEA